MPRHKVMLTLGTPYVRHLWNNVCGIFRESLTFAPLD